MPIVYDEERDEIAKCPFMGSACVTECMLMRPTEFGEPRCSFRVIADELVQIAGVARVAAKYKVGGGIDDR